MLTSPAQGAVSGSHVILVSPNDNIVLIEGLNDSTEYTVTVTRGGTPIGGVTATPAAFGVAGALEINHGAAPTLCWGQPATPDIQPGDVVTMTDSGGTFTDTVPVRNVTMAPAGATPADGPDADTDANDAFTVSGTVDPALLPNLEVFIRLAVGAGATDWRATATQGDPDNPIVADVAGNWTATFTEGDTVVNADVLAAAEAPRVLDASVVFGANEITSVGPDAGDPHPPECPPVASHSLSTVTPGVINQANDGTNLTVSGATSNSTGVTVNVSDGTNAIGPIDADIIGAGTSQTWTATVPAADLTGLTGTLTVTATHAPNLGLVAQNSKTVLKDIVAPSSPTFFPDGGSFTGSVQVFLNAGPGDTIRYTLGDGTQAAPTPTSGQPYTGQFSLGQSATVKAVAFDAVGNPSAVMTRTFTRTGPPVGTPPVVTPPGGGSAAIVALAPGLRQAKSGKPGGNDTATAKWRAPVANGAVLNGYEVRALKMRPGRSAKIRPAVVVEDRDAKKLKMSLPAGKYRFQVRAVSAAGKSPWSERSNQVRSR